MSSRLLVSAALLLASPVQAADDFQAECRVQMSEAEFASANLELFGKGMRLVDITVSDVQGKPVVGAIWERVAGMPAGTPELAKTQSALVFLKLDEQALRAKGEDLGLRGSRAEVIDAYQVDGKTWFAASFAPPGAAQMQVVGAFLDSDQAADMREGAIKSGHDYARIDVYFEGGRARMLPVFIHRGETEIESQVFDRTVAINAAGVGMSLKDMHPLAISVFKKDGRSHWLATWDKGPARDFILADAGDEIRKRIAAGDLVVDIDSQAEDNGKVFYYAVVQDRKR